MKNRNALFWWIFLWAQVIASFLFYKAGVFQMIWDGDATKLTSVVLVAFVLTTFKIGIDTYNSNGDHVEPLWFVADQMMSVGMLGTVVGFIIMLRGAFGSGIPTTPQEIQQVLTYMSIGMGTALWTTAVGIAASILLKIQVMNLEHMLREKPGGEG